MEYDAQADAIYVERSDKPYHRNREIGGGRLIDYAEDGTVIGVEFLGVSRGIDLTDVPHRDAIERLLSTQFRFKAAAT